MTSKEFEVMRKAQKHETNLAILRELDSVRAEIKELVSRKLSGGYGTIGSVSDEIIGIIDEHIKELE